MKNFAQRCLTTSIALAASLFCAAHFTRPAQAQDNKQARKADDSGGGGDVDRGRYIVENVAMCGRCHTPHNELDQPELNSKLMGAPIVNRLPMWAVAAPRIAGQPPGTDDQFITLLTTGIARTGRPPNPPMPRFHMTRRDAESVLAYLKSLRR